MQEALRQRQAVATTKSERIKEDKEKKQKRVKRDRQTDIQTLQSKAVHHSSIQGCPGVGGC